MSGVDVLAVMLAAPKVTVAGVTILHNARKWRVCTNSHSTSDGFRWGWIEGTPGNVCWENGRAFNESAAHEMVEQHNQWLEDQKPLSIKMIEARQRYAEAAKKHDAAHDAFKAASMALKDAEDELAALARAQGGAA